MTPISVARISKGGQVSVPADVRRRWESLEVTVEDRGDHLVLRPIPADPVKAAMGSIKPSPGVTGDDLIRQFREEEEAIERRKYGE